MDAFLAQLKQRLNAIENPYLRALRDGSLSREDFIETQVQFLFAVVFFSRPMAVLAGRLPRPEMRLALLENVHDEHGAGNLLARVIVNRLWQHHMGKGIVGTPNDFGVQGDPPTHPELLDYLARELIKNGWRLKAIHKLIMTSAVYMQSNAINEANVKVDPANKLWWRRPTRRRSWS